MSRKCKGMSGLFIAAALTASLAASPVMAAASGPEVTAAEVSSAAEEVSTAAEEAVPAAEEAVSAAEDVSSAAEDVAAALPEEELLTSIPESYFVREGISGVDKVKSLGDAAGVIEGLAADEGWDERARFEPWRTLTDTAGNVYYVFRQMYGDVTVSGGAVKVVTDPEGKLLGVVSSVETAMPDEDAAEGISSAEAEEVVRSYLEENDEAGKEILGDHTVKVILPVNPVPDFNDDDAKPDMMYVWAVYTNNVGESMKNGSDLPYLAHYVTMAGEYLYSLPTVIPNDEAGTSGYASAYTFEFMEPAKYTGTVTLCDGTERELTVDVMRDSRTGMYYLGDVARRIAVADYYEMIYNDGNIILEASPDNTGWEQASLIALYNYSRAWDYYNEIGWEGGDGLGTPILILKDFCDINHYPIDNAAYAGAYYGWQMFVSSSGNTFGEALDILAHEFTHCVTHSVMTYNAYMNDYGAINEAISDIHGNICERMAREDENWDLGERSGYLMRSMSDPHSTSQPEYTWDIFYKSNVAVPTAVNDRGGVHTNSSLLNRVAYLLCEEGGMTLEDARAFWFAVDCSMVPGTDYPQLAELMPWVMDNIGMQKYIPSLEKILEETKLGEKEAPRLLDDDRSLVMLELPDNGEFDDGNWALQIISVNPEVLTERIDALKKGEGEYAADKIAERLIGAAGRAIFEDEGIDALKTEVKDMLSEFLDGVVYSDAGSAGQDGSTVKLVSKSGITIPILYYLDLDMETMEPVGVGLAAYVYGEWVDIGSMLAEAMEAEQDPGSMEESVLEIVGFAEKLISRTGPVWDVDVSKLLDKAFFEIEGARVTRIPSKGLENVRHYTEEDLEKLFEVIDSAMGKMHEENAPAA